MTLWELGSIQEVVWQMDANNEGGYSYRLCKIPDGKMLSILVKYFMHISMQMEKLDMIEKTSSDLAEIWCFTS